jgi:hypothetical protein
MMNYRDREQAKGWILIGMSILAVTLAIIMVVPSSINTFRFFYPIINQQSPIIKQGES